MTWKRGFIFLLIVVLLAACSSKDSGAESAKEKQTEDTVKLEFWTINLKEGYSDYIENSIAKYEEDNPGVEINWVDVPDFDQTDTRLLTAIRGGNAPDVVNVTPFMIPKFVNEDVLVSVDDIKEGLSDEYVEAFWNAGVINGKAYAIPFYGSVPSVIINTKVFKEAGLDPEDPPQTWEEVKEYSHIIKEKTGIAGNIQTINNFDDSGNPIDILARNSTQLLNDEGTEAIFNSPEGVKALQDYVDMYQDGSMHSDSLTGDMMDAAARFSNEEVGMLFLGPWILRWLEDNTSEDVFKHFKAYPGIRGTDGKLNSFLQSFAIPKDSEHKEQALDFAVFFSGTTMELIKSAPVAPTKKELLEDPYFKEGPVEIQIVKEGLPDAQFNWPLVPGLMELIQVTRNEFQEAALDRKTAQEALDDAVKRWNQILSQ